MLRNGGRGAGLHRDGDEATGHFLSFVADLAANANVVIGGGC